MNNTYLIFEYDKFSIWETPMKFDYEEDPAIPLPEDGSDSYKINAILNTCKRLEEKLIPIAKPKGIIRKIYNFLFDKTLGYCDYVSIKSCE